MSQYFLMIAAGSGFFAVLLGAFGAHSLKSRLSESLMSAFQTGVQYHFYHTLALLAVALLMQRSVMTTWVVSAGYSFIAGILLFSGSLYALAFGGPRWLGPVTPLGGLCFMAGWLCLLISAWRMES